MLPIVFLLNFKIFKFLNLKISYMYTLFCEYIYLIDLIFPSTPTDTLILPIYSSSYFHVVFVCQFSSRNHSLCMLVIMLAMFYQEETVSQHSSISQVLEILEYIFFNFY